jgi:hypothetical protein
MAKMAKEILQNQDFHVTAYKMNLQQRLNEAFAKDKTHTQRLSE